MWLPIQIWKIATHHYLKMGVHLSFLGNDIFINIIQGALEQFLLNPYTKLYPV
jgi:hypothetical protein